MVKHLTFNQENGDRYPDPLFIMIGKNMHNKIKGTIGEAKILHDLLEKEFRVFTEFGDLSKIDLIAEKDNKLFRFQVKAYHSKNGVVNLERRKRGPNYKFVYQEKDVDIFAVYVLDKDLIFYVSSEDLCSAKTQLSFRIDPPKKKQTKNIRYLKDYTLEKALSRDKLKW